MNREEQRVSIIVPTLNASGSIEKLLVVLNKQTVKPLEVIVIDSSSQDNTAEIAKSLGAEVVVIPKQEFDHGATRNLGCKRARGEIVVYLTQDALPTSEKAIENLLKPFHENEKVAVSFGRQVPFSDATPVAAHLRLFNYPAESYIRGLKDKEKFGIKTVFLSNSFAAYRKKALEEIDFFKENLIFGEDTYAGAKLLLADYRIAYAADAAVYHSHNYKLSQEFKRYFDIGVFHKTESWIVKTFGKPSGEGFKYVFSEIKYLFRNKKSHWFPRSMLTIMLKYTAYRLGCRYVLLPKPLTWKLSMNKNWWDSSR
jgi:rhamnosyltransferase